MANLQLQEDIEEGRVKYPPPHPQSIYAPPQLALGPVVFVKSVAIPDASRLITLGVFIKQGTQATCLAINKSVNHVSHESVLVRLENGKCYIVDSSLLRNHHEAV